MKTAIEKAARRLKEARDAERAACQAHERAEDKTRKAEDEYEKLIFGRVLELLKACDWKRDASYLRGSQLVCSISTRSELWKLVRPIAQDYSLSLLREGIGRLYVRISSIDSNRKEFRVENHYAKAFNIAIPKSAANRRSSALRKVRELVESTKPLDDEALEVLKGAREELKS